MVSCFFLLLVAVSSTFRDFKPYLRCEIGRACSLNKTREDEREKKREKERKIERERKKERGEEREREREREREEKREKERERENRRKREEREALRVCIEKRLRVYVQNVTVCTGTHGDVLNAHTGVFQRDTPQHTTTPQHKPNTPPQHTTSQQHKPNTPQHTTTTQKDTQKGKKTKQKKKKEKRRIKREKKVKSPWYTCHFHMWR